MILKVLRKSKITKEVSEHWKESKKMYYKSQMFMDLLALRDESFQYILVGYISDENMAWISHENMNSWKLVYWKVSLHPEQLLS
jgi:hypothetical protein